MRKTEMVLFVLAALATLLFTAVMVGMTRHAHAMRYPSTYPSVQDLQRALNAYPGAQIPAKEVVMNGHVWTAYYVGARAIGGGRYSVVIQLR